MPLINGSQFPQTVLVSVRRSFPATFRVTAASLLEAKMFFSSTLMVEKAVSAKAPKSSLSYSTGTLLGYTVQKLSKTWMAFAEAANLATLAKLVAPYNWFDSEKKRYHSTDQAGPRICASLAVAPYTAWKRRCRQRG